jgi:N-acetylmuramoyl-L-alanine amidase
MFVDKKTDFVISNPTSMKVKDMFDKKRILSLLCIVVYFMLFISLNLFAAEKKRTMLIDPAHGGQDVGVQLTGSVYEKDITLAVALLIKKELAEENNIEVVLIRDSDKTVSTEERRRAIEKLKPDFCLSIHVNAGFGHNASGFEIYYSEYDEQAATGKKSTKDDLRQLRNKLSNDSLTMAKIVQDHLNVLFPRKGRGLRKADNPTVAGLHVPSLVVEMGFGTHSDDKKKLVSSKTQADIAKAFASSIRKYFR